MRPLPWRRRKKEEKEGEDKEKEEEEGGGGGLISTAFGHIIQGHFLLEKYQVRERYSGPIVGLWFFCMAIAGSLESMPFLFTSSPTNPQWDESNRHPVSCWFLLYHPYLTHCHCTGAIEESPSTVSFYPILEQSLFLTPFLMLCAVLVPVPLGSNLTSHLFFPVYPGVFAQGSYSLFLIVIEVSNPSMSSPWFKLTLSSTIYVLPWPL